MANYLPGRNSTYNITPRRVVDANGVSQPASPAAGGVQVVKQQSTYDFVKGTATTAAKTAVSGATAVLNSGKEAASEVFDAAKLAFGPKNDSTTTNPGPLNGGDFNEFGEFIPVGGDPNAPGFTGPSVADPDAAETFPFDDGGEIESSRTDQLQDVATGQDWRVKLTLPPLANYLYNAVPAGILQPLKDSRGLIFPYTPTISMQHAANYESYELVHSNYKGYFYKGSAVQNIMINAVFTAQDTNEANYMLAALHFLRSATKMFYGLDSQRGMPPPVLMLSGFGEYQFKNHPCVVTMMNVNLPNDVDYIAAGVPDSTNPNTGFTTGLAARTGHRSWSSAITAGIGRMMGAGVPPGAENNNKTTQQQVNNNTGDMSGLTQTYDEKTYVPTKLDINFTMLPIQTRKQVSTQFSLKKYASGDLLKGGFW
jgi:hypothetical protein